MSPSARVLAVAIALAGFSSCAADDGDGPTPVCATGSHATHTTVVCFGSVAIEAELATTLAERQTGLMGRASLPDTAGMLFVFAGDAQRDFYMKDTPINLSIAFLDANKKILNIAEMTALDEVTIHHSAGSARYALEMRAGWFAARNITAGATASFTLPAGIRIDP